MKAFSIPDRIRALFFDIDNTLYSNKAYAAHQYDVLYAALAVHLHREPGSLRDEVEAWRSMAAEQNGGLKPSLGTAFLHRGVSIATSVDWRSRYIRPQNYLGPDPELRRVLELLSFRGLLLAAVTNNPVDTGLATLECLGVENLIQSVIGLDSAGASKPDSPHFHLALKAAGVEADSCISVGDRFGIDIKPALEMGMGGILVDGVEDVYRLPELLFPGTGN